MAKLAEVRCGDRLLGTEVAGSGEQISYMVLRVADDGDYLDVSVESGRAVPLLSALALKGDAYVDVRTGISVNLQVTPRNEQMRAEDEQEPSRLWPFLAIRGSERVFVAEPFALERPSMTKRSRTSLVRQQLRRRTLGPMADADFIAVATWFQGSSK